MRRLLRVLRDRVKAVVLAYWTGLAQPGAL